MTDEQRHQLAVSVRKIIGDLRVEDALELYELLHNTAALGDAVLRVVFEYIQRDLLLEIVE